VKSRGTPGFWKAYQALPGEIKLAARAAYQKFRENPAHPSLHLERLRSDPRFWSVRVTRDYRAVAQRFAGDNWIWVWIGSHRDFDRQFPV
jgi:plasmid maintenance system killer protein